jgi:hypothetical protein
MTYINGTINTGQDADLYNAMATALATNGYSLVDTQVISTRTHKVWKNPAANNSSGQDWFLDIAYSTTGQAGLYIHPFEAYDAVNHLGIRGVITGGTSFTPESTYYSRYGTTGFALETNWLQTSDGIQLPTSASSYGYMLSIDTERISGFTTASTSAICYVGLITLSLRSATAAGTAALPLVVNTTAGYRQTRHPKRTTAGVPTFGFLTSFATNTVQFPSGDFNSMAACAEPVRVAPNSVTGTSIAAYAGTLKGVVALNVDASVNRGDEITIGADTYVINGTLTAGIAYCVVKR